MSGRLTTHVVDTANGCPAGEMAIELWLLDEAFERRKLVTTARTNADGRTDEPLVRDGELSAGVYELVFFVSDYFQRRGGLPSSLPFLSRVPVRFGINDPTTHYHVPLLVSPWSYSTYRGS